MTVRSYMEFHPKIGDRVFIDSSAVVIGNVELGVDCSVWPMTVIRGDVHTIRIGDRTNIQDGSVLHITSPESFGPDGFPLNIGDDVTIGHRAVLHGCTIKDRVLIGMGALVMDGAVIESDIILGGGSVVSPGKTLTSGGLYVGSPAQRIRDLRQEEIDFLLYSARHYAKLKDLHLNSSETLK